MVIAMATIMLITKIIGMILFPIYNTSIKSYNNHHKKLYDVHIRRFAYNGLFILLLGTIQEGIMWSRSQID